MENYQREFFDFVIKTDALRFGEFTLKSGRVSPYFFNSGLFSEGASVALLGHYYAAALVNSSIAYDMIYGPAYKGIPLAVTTAIALNNDFNQNIPFSFNRKEAKDHGEGGIIVGSPLKGKVLIIDDVISAGTSVRESINIINAAGATPAGVVISLDRQERGTGNTSAIQEIKETTGMDVASIASLADLITYLKEKKNQQQTLSKIQAYRDQYGS